MGSGQSEALGSFLHAVPCSRAEQGHTAPCAFSSRAHLPLPGACRASQGLARACFTLPRSSEHLGAALPSLGKHGGLGTPRGGTAMGSGVLQSKLLPPKAA